VESRIWRHFDLPLLLTSVVLSALGVAAIYSATLGTETNDSLDSRVIRQVIYVAVGMLIMAALATTDYRVWSNLAYPAYGLTLAALLAVNLIGRVAHGSQRSFHLVLFDVQPSELAKLVLALVLARFATTNPDGVRSWRAFGQTLLLAGAPTLLTLAQPDLGTATVFVIIWLSVVVVAGARLLHLGTVFAIALASAPLIWISMPAYQKDRVMVFINPQADELGSGYNVIQALISVGSGGLLGRGFLSGTQSQLHFLRVQYADFIFSVVAEEFGFVGAVILIAFLALLILRGLRVAGVSRDAFGRLVAVGIVSSLFWQTFVNAGMNVGILPVTGVPLPLISYGGSSAMTVLACIGVLQSISMRHRRFEL
jgi:rod shape determining protein RodA